MKISVHLASTQERAEAHQSSFESWGRGKSLEDYLTRREGSPVIKRAQWWVLTVDSQVASALGLQPLRFDAKGETVEGFGFGSVFPLVRIFLISLMKLKKKC